MAILAVETRRELVIQRAEQRSRITGRDVPQHILLASIDETPGVFELVTINKWRKA